MASIVSNSASISVSTMSEKIVKLGRTSFILSPVFSKNIDFSKSYEKLNIV